MSEDEGLLVNYTGWTKTESKLDPETGNYIFTVTGQFPDPKGPIWKIHKASPHENK
jgi:hypothetical protein